MPYAPSKHHRRSIRLKGYDYTLPGAYFITICTQDRTCLFDDVVDGEMRLNSFGKIVAESWQWLALQYDYIELDEWVLMPNHLHGIIVMTDCMGGSRTAHTMNRKPIGRLVVAFKTVSTKRINEYRGTPGATVWQRNHCEHIICNDQSMQRIREYILTNSLRWHLDRENVWTVGVAPLTGEQVE